MVNRLVLSILLIVGFLVLANGQDNSILINGPTKIESGSEFFMVINVPENYMQGVARLQIVLPNGFTAKAKKIDNADFKFKDQKATFQWLNFPKNKVVEVSLSISVNPTIEGYFVMKGSADWIKNTEPLHANIYPKVITVAKGSTENDLIIRQKSTKITFEDFESDGVACIRQVPYIKNGEVVVNILVSKADFNRYGKIQEKIPVGYSVKNIKSQNAIFVYNEKQRLVKFMWMKMPDASKFLVSYNLVPTKDIDDSNPFIIYGTFYYAVDNKTEIVDIQEREIELGEYN